MTETPDLAALLASRICHDLISPIGAIGNGVELLMMEGHDHAPEMQLIADSVRHANARIRFFRLAFGMTGVIEQRCNRGEVVSILSDLTHGTRLTIDWQGPPDPSRREVKLAFLAQMCLESALPHGGKIWVDRLETGWSLRAESPKLRYDPTLWGVLESEAADHAIAPAQVHFILLRNEVARQHRRLSVAIEEATIALRF